MKRSLPLLLCFVAFLGVAAGLDPFPVRPWVERPSKEEVASREAATKPFAPQQGSVHESRATVERPPKPGLPPSAIDDEEPASTAEEVLAGRQRGRKEDRFAQEFFERVTGLYEQNGLPSPFRDLFVPDWRENLPEAKAAEALAELRRLAVEHPVEFDKAVASLWRDHSTIGPVLDDLLEYRESLRKCDALLRPLDALPLPSVRGCRREGLFRGAEGGIPTSPWLRGRNVTAAWDVGGKERGDLMLFDDGVVRRGYPGGWLVSFPTEVHRFLSRTAADPATERLLLQAMLFARWAFQQREYKLGLACAVRAREIGARAWPGESDDQLGKRAARYGNEVRGRNLMVAELVVIHRSQLSDALRDLEYERAIRMMSLEARWGELSNRELLALPLSEQIEVAFWKAARWHSVAVELDELSTWLRLVAGAKRDPDEPAAWLRSFGWDGVPALVEHLADLGGTSTLHREHEVCIADLSWLALQDFTGLPNSSCLDPESPWITQCDDFDEQVLSVRAWWASVASLPEVDRWESLFRRGSMKAAKWLMSHAPERCLMEAWKRFDPATRRGLVDRRACEIAMQSAPREKLEALLGSVEGDARESVQRALEAQGAK